ncbi:type III secretion system inner membrane ring lipoprotein SctJ [Duganella violaceipulchra]|uniref:Lipoprotein n=1 Tax=Duganella violaceipulchra TaxID=2849652 RepID=A0AA41HDC5_9BURK|nr:type III secretion inner membrane ring lipoprotein SctJ [Duganella violaceicalia]MCP2010664.1 type III secretion protein J [Duganella violaceicalia]
MPTTISSARRRNAVALVCCLLLPACSRSVPLYSGLSEGDANDIVAALLSNGIYAGKASSKQGYIVSVEGAELAAAVALLHERGLPRNAFARMGDIFKKDGMISSPTEERARYLAALAQELENTLSQIDGVVMARVHPVLPERLVPGEPVVPSSCAVMIKYRPGWEPDAYEDRIRRLILASMPGLAATGAQGRGVAIVFVPATPSPARPGATAARARPPYLWAAAPALALAAAGALGAYGLRIRRRVRAGSPAVESSNDPV